MPPFTPDSRAVEPGMTYVAIRGANVDGHRFIPEAIRRGAAAVIYSEDIAERPDDVEFIRVPDSRAAYAGLCRDFHGRPDEKLALVGVTGTNGKTTTVYLIEFLLRSCGIPCGLISTVETRTVTQTRPATHTTPSPERFYEILAETLAHGGRAAAMELSSHALDQRRVDGIRLAAGVFTNLTGDHLDYHGDMDSYFRAKRRMFEEMLAPNGVAVINTDDACGRTLFDSLRPPKISFGTSADADVLISEIELHAGHSEFTLTRDGRACRLRTNLLGNYNLFNLTGALLAAEAAGADWNTLITLAASLPPVPGRLEEVVSPEGVRCFVDYAHTDDALEKALRVLRPIAGGGRLIVVFGCGGDRDRSKRPRMGLAAAKFADKVIVTSDNPRSENPQSIIDEIVSGIPRGTDYSMECDRELAIRLARKIARGSDLILVAGKGHEREQEIAGVKYPFDDREMIRKGETL